jgi:hypothetical protein
MSVQVEVPLFLLILLLTPLHYHQLLAHLIFLALDYTHSSFHLSSPGQALQFIEQEQLGKLGATLDLPN